MEPTILGKHIIQALEHVERHVRQKRHAELDIAYRELEQQMHVDDDVKVNAFMRAQDLLKDALLEMLHTEKPFPIRISFDPTIKLTKGEQEAAAQGAQKGYTEYYRITHIDVKLKKIGVHESIARYISVHVLQKPHEVRAFLRTFEREMPLLLPPLRLSGPQ